MPKHVLCQIAQQALLENPAGELLILCRRDGHWHFAGGRLNENESWEDGLRREVCEETGITEFEIRQIMMVANWTWHERPMYGVYFDCFTDSTEIKLSREHAAFRWLNRNDHLDEINWWHPNLRMLAAQMLRRE